MERRLSIGKNNRLACDSLAINPRYVFMEKQENCQYFSVEKKRKTKTTTTTNILPGALIEKEGPDQTVQMHIVFLKI